MGKSTISMVIFHSYVSLPEGKCHLLQRLIFHRLNRLNLPEARGPKLVVET